MLTNERIRKVALDSGFKLKEQPNGEMDLNPYVYEFARRLMDFKDDDGVVEFGLKQDTHFDQIAHQVNNSVKMTFDEATTLITTKLNELNRGLTWTSVEESGNTRFIICSGLGSNFAILVSADPFNMQTGTAVNNTFKTHYEVLTPALEPVLLEKAKATFNELINGKVK